MLFGPGQFPEKCSFCGLAPCASGKSRRADMGAFSHIHAGDSCVPTTTCLLASDDFAAKGTAETDFEAVGAPRERFDEAVAWSKPFREFVFASLAKRIPNPFVMIDEVAFQWLDGRLADRLITRSDGTNGPAITHQSGRSNLAGRGRPSRGRCRNFTGVAGSNRRAVSCIFLPATGSKRARCGNSESRGAHCDNVTDKAKPEA